MTSKYNESFSSNQKEMTNINENEDFVKTETFLQDDQFHDSFEVRVFVSEKHIFILKPKIMVCKIFK